MNYFIVENGQQAGPYSVDELLNHGLNSDTLVWAEGMSDWTPAWQVAELKDVIYAKQQSAATPPPISSSSQPASSQSGSSQQQYSQPSSFQSQAVQEPVRKKGGDSHTFLWIGMAIILFAAVLLGVTCPDRSRHQEVVKENITNALTQTMSDALPLPKQLRQISSAFGGSVVAGVVEPLLDQVLVYHNYIFFSTTTIEFGGSSHTASVGLLGKVFTVGEASMVKALKDNINKPTDSKSDNDWLSSPNADEQTDAADDASTADDATTDSQDDAQGDDEELVNDVKNVVKKHVKKQIDPNDEKGVGAIIDKVIDMI